jgi:hypothetical protein
MAAKDRPGKIGEAELKGYLKRLVEDEELRGNLLSAYGSARSAYGRMTNGKSATKELLEDSELQRELTHIAASLRDASSSLLEPPEARKRSSRRRRGPRSLLLLAVGGALAIGLSSGLRAKVLDLLFGAEEEFDYSSTTAPAEPAPVGAPAS